ncbi:uncharacterized protein LOC110458869 [Mizuhopecten yessoensis]|uniref:uncharacterized protein LOC110458869 n=1 Tax=Mizuhopecten yessoensis TaxID=6573 RepID=UPI000B458894|nr:uncharacterized protein LOC110458869 [Mizuhopecten yessoensis]
MAGKTLFVLLCYCIASSTFIKVVSMELVSHWLSGGYVQCYPVVCLAGFQASFCKLDRTSDYCHSCPVGSTQDIIVDTRTLRSQNDVPKCSRIDIACLQPETTPVVENGIIARCECDLSNGYIGEDPLCMKVNRCFRGEELDKSSGRCSPCQKGSYKNTTGYEFCQPWTSCETLGRETLKVGNTTADTVCGKRLQTTNSEPSLYPTANTFSVTLKCGTGDCLTKADQTEFKEDVMDSTLQHQNKTDQHHSKDCGERSLQYAVVIAIMMLMLLIMAVCFLRISCKLDRTPWKGFRLSTRNEKDIEMCFKQGIQEENGIAKHEAKTASEKSTPFDDCDQPATLYPPINEQPAEPTAPELSMQGNLQPLIHVPPSCCTCDVYVPKGNYG